MPAIADAVGDKIEVHIDVAESESGYDLPKYRRQVESDVGTVRIYAEAA